MPFEEMGALARETNLLSNVETDHPHEAQGYVFGGSLARKNSVSGV
jgi:hypothetical protein